MNTYIFDLFVQEHCNSVSNNLFDDTISKLRKNNFEKIMRNSIDKMMSQAIIVVNRPSTDGLSPGIFFPPIFLYKIFSRHFSLNILYINENISE